jgi:hypothetical protein
MTLKRHAFGFVLPKGVADRRKTRTFAIAAEQIGKAYFARREPHGRPRDRRLANIERLPIAANPAADHNEPGLNRAQLDVVKRFGERGEAGGDLVGVRSGQCSHQGLTSRDAIIRGCGIHVEAFPVQVVYDTIQLTRRNQ